MRSEFVIKPLEGWAPGDRAYCLEGTRLTDPPLERGKVYEVAEVIPVKGHVEDGLIIRNVRPLNGKRGMWSNRFVKLARGRSGMASLRALTRRKWEEAYFASVGYAPHPDA